MGSMHVKKTHRSHVRYVAGGNYFSVDEGRL